MRLDWNEQEQRWVVVVDGREQSVDDFDPTLAAELAGLDITALELRAWEAGLPLEGVADTHAEIMAAISRAGYGLSEAPAAPAVPEAPAGPAVPAGDATVGGPDWYQALRQIHSNIPSWDQLGFAPTRSGTPEFSFDQYRKDYDTARGMAVSEGLVDDPSVRAPSLDQLRNEARAAGDKAEVDRLTLDMRREANLGKEPPEAKVPSFAQQILDAEAAGDTDLANQLAARKNELARVGQVEDEEEPLNLRTAGEAQMAAAEASRVTGRQFEVVTRGGFYGIAEVEAGPRRSLDQRIEDLADADEWDRALALDKIRDLLTRQRTLTPAQAISIATEGADGDPAAFQTILNDLMAIDFVAEAAAAQGLAPPPPSLEQAAPSLFQGEPVGRVGRLASPEAPSGFADPSVRPPAGIPPVPSIPGSYEDVWQRTYDEAFAAAIAEGDEQDVANRDAVQVANEAVTPEPAVGLSPTQRAIAGFGPDSETPLIRGLRAIQQGAYPVLADPELAQTFQLGTEDEQRGALAETSRRQGFTGLDVSGLTPGQRTRFFQTQPSEEELLQTVGASLNREDIDNLLAGGGLTMVSGPGGTFRANAPTGQLGGGSLAAAQLSAASFGSAFEDQGVGGFRRLKPPDERQKGTQFLTPIEDIATRFGITPDEAQGFRTRAQGRRSESLRLGRGLQQLADISTRSTGATRVYRQPRITRFR